MKTRQYLAIILLAFPTTLVGQSQPKDTTLNRTLVVEQEYNPDIADAAKINVMPQVEPLSAPKTAVAYDVNPAPAKDVPGTRMTAYSGKERPSAGRPGYVRAGYGNRGNLDVLASYHTALGKKDKLGIDFSMTGMDGSIDLADDQGTWNAYRYHTRAAVDYQHDFSKLNLNVAGHFGLNNFNFLPQTSARKQKFTAGDVHVGIASTAADLPVQFRAETNVMLFGRQYNTLYGETDYIGSIRETLVRTKAEATGALSDAQYIGLALAMDNVVYDKNDMSNHTSIDLNPYYQYQRGAWLVRAGLHANIGIDLGNAIYLTPDVWAQYTFGRRYTLYAQAKGGRLQNDFRRLQQLNPYALPSAQLLPTYEQVNAAIGLKASPTDGLWLHVYGGWQRLADDVYTLPVYTGSMDYDLMQDDADQAYAGAEVSYAYKDRFAINVQGVFHRWNSDYEETQLYLKPALELGGEVQVRPLPRLQICADYHFTSREGESHWKAESINDLGLQANYEVLDRFTVYARANNLLNKKYELQRGYLAQGFHFTAGLSYLF